MRSTKNRKNNVTTTAYSAKGGVYGIRTPLERLKYPTRVTLKIGHSTNLKKRFSTYNTGILDEEDFVENNLNFILHSPLYSFDSTDILESITHWYLKSCRLKKQKEFFQFDEDFDIGDYFDGLNYYFKLSNIRDVSPYTEYDKVPETVIPSGYNPDLSRDKSPFQPRECQVSIIEAGVSHFREHDSGGIYLPPGYGKTYITTFIIRDLRIKSGIVFTHRLSIVREWEKCFTLANIPYVIINSEEEYNLQEHSDSDIFILTTYQTYRLKPEEFNPSYPIIIHDEAHVLVSGEKYRECLALQGKKLYLTATPSMHRFEDDMEKCITEELDEATFGKTITHISLEDAISQGCLCGYRILAHNKPSTVECIEHVTDLFDKYGRKKIIIFYNRCEDAKQSLEHLQEHGIRNSWYIDGNTTRKERERIFQHFEACEKGVIVNVNVLSEGVSIPCVDCILMMDKRNSQKALIQILGRALRIHPGKSSAILCIPTDCSDTLEIALTALVYDSKGKKKISERVLVEPSEELMEESENIVRDLNRRLQWIEICREGGSICNYKIKLLSEIVCRTGKLVKQKFITETGEKLGIFQHCLLQTLCGRLSYFSSNLSKWRIKYSCLFEFLDERAKNIIENPNNRITTPEHKIKKLSDIVNEEKKLVIAKYIDKNGEKLGIFQDNLIGAINGRHKRFEEDLLKWREKYPYLFELIEQRVKNNIKTRCNIIIKPEDKIRLLANIVWVKKKLVIQKFIDENGNKLGCFQGVLIGALSGANKRFEKKIPEWKDKYPYLFTLLNERAKDIISSRK